MRRLICLSVICAVLFAGCKSSSVFQIQEKNFSSPEKAITALYKSLISADFAGCLRTCAIREYSSNFNFAANTKKFKTMNQKWMSPTEYPLYADINQAQQIGSLAQQIKMVFYVMLGTEDFLGNSSVAVINDTQDKDDAQIEAFVKSINPEKMRNLKLVKIGIPHPSIFTSEHSQKVFKEGAAIYGADEMTERVALFSKDNSYYSCGFTLYRYGKNWRIGILSSNIACTPFSSGFEKVSPEDFESSISD